MPSHRRPFDELGAHVSAAGGVHRAPQRAHEIGAVVLQLFTKQPSRWAEPSVDRASAEAFRRALDEHDIRVAGAHDSYLINLATPDRELWRRSRRSFTAELRRCAALGLDFLVTHPGNATDGDIECGLQRNARGIAESLADVERSAKVLLELTAGSGTTVGATFENLSVIIESLPDGVRSRVGICFDTCHAFSAGYDLVGGYESVWEDFDRILGLERLGLLHLNDSKHPFDTRKDRHEEIGQGTLGLEPFRRIMCDPRLSEVPKILETPKGDDPVRTDRRNLGRLRGLRSVPAARREPTSSEDTG